MSTPVEINAHIERRCELAQQAIADGDVDTAWTALGEAHILSQPWPVAHTRVHWRMLVPALKLGLWREARGQIPRLAVAGVASAVGTVPVGNSGRSNVSATQPHPMTIEIAELIVEHLPARARLPEPLTTSVG